MWNTKLGLSCAIMVLLLLGVSSALAQDAKVYAVLVLDTKGEGLAKALESDREMVEKMLRGGIGEEFLVFSYVKDTDVTLAGLKKHLADLPLRPGVDTLFCYVGCHGGTDKRTRQHVLQFSGGGRHEMLKRSEVRRALEGKEARLTVFVSDSCSNEDDFLGPDGATPRIGVYGPLRGHPGTLPRRFSAPGRREIRKCFRSLFLNTKGMVDINGSFENSYAWFHPESGGVFTRSLYDTFEKFQDKEPSGWAEFYRYLKDTTQKTYVTWQQECCKEFEKKKTDKGLTAGESEDYQALKDQTEQTPQLFFLSGARLGLIVQDKDNIGVEITDLPLNSPARAAGLKVRDVIVKVNGSAIGSLEDLDDVLGPALRETAPVLTFEIRRATATKTITVKLAPK